MMKNSSFHKFIAAGGGNETGASCYMIYTGGVKIMLDAGIRNARDFMAGLPNLIPVFRKFGWDGLWELDAAVISHAHVDHTGALPFFIKDLEGVKIFSSEATPEMIYAQHGNKKSNALASTYDKLIPVPFMKKIAVKNSDITLFPAGHIPGAAMTLIENDEAKILYTGDFCDFDQFTVKGAKIPDMKINALICESTYAYSNSIGQLNLNDLANQINKLLVNTNIFMCTVRNSGKAAEIVAAVKKCVEFDLIPALKIWLDTDAEISCKACEKWGAAKIFDDSVEKLSDCDFNSEGLIISSQPLGFDELFFNMSNHADCSGILKLIATTRPDKIIFVHGTPSFAGARNVLREIPERFGTAVDVVHSINGIEFNLI